ncbi:MAG: penicillin-insensitive murein endopeptidase [Myxococcales bacterium]|nr:penicillin-insensitive murein endopeptidase [Myxococcales bacterium]
MGAPSKGVYLFFSDVRGILKRAVGTCYRYLAVTVVLLGATLSTGCIYDGLVLEDGSGFSRGPSRYGMLYEGVKLPTRGEGHWIPPTWAARGLNYGVDEMVSTVVYAGRRLKMQDSRLELAVGDISRAKGGRSPWHRSHQTGRDVDFLFLLKDKAGRPMRNDRMRKHAPSGAERVAEGEKPAVFFDERGNWLLVEALLESPVAEIQYIFVQEDLRQKILAYAVKSGVSQAMVEHATQVMKQPSDSAPHDDHLHVRIYCPWDDVSAGCVDMGQMRWHKKDLKYGGRVERIRRYDEVLSNIDVGAFAPLLR